MTVYKYYFILIALLLSTFNFVVLKLNPMVEMAFRSQCKNPLTSWNGKVLGFRIWKDSSKTAPRQFSIHGNVDEYSNDKWSVSMLDFNDCSSHIVLTMNSKYT